jgi:NAD-dependent SIR2 family protein deacetylase
MLKGTFKDTKSYESKINEIVSQIQNAEAIVIGAGSGLSTAAGLTYNGKRFTDHFSDFISKYGKTMIMYDCVFGVLI